MGKQRRAEKRLDKARTAAAWKAAMARQRAAMTPGQRFASNPLVNQFTWGLSGGVQQPVTFYPWEMKPKAPRGQPPLRWNGPPNWPPCPQGWEPPPGWQPDPSWPVPPPGWQFWVPSQ